MWTPTVTHVAASATTRATWRRSGVGMSFSAHRAGGACGDARVEVLEHPARVGLPDPGVQHIELTGARHVDLVEGLSQQLRRIRRVDLGCRHDVLDGGKLQPLSCDFVDERL